MASQTMLTALILLVSGLAILVSGAEALVRGSASLARRMGVQPLVVGLTVVAFGTSTPELTVNIFAAVRGAPDIAIGNIVGSNTANILLILGLSAALAPLRIKTSTVWKEISFALLAMVLVLTMGNDALFDGSPFNSITRTDGFSLLSLFAIFMFYIFGLSRIETAPADIRTYSYPVSCILIALGLGLLYFGGKTLVDGAVTLARIAGLSEAFIGLTIIAVGTSLPELATSVVAAIHGEDEIAVGNIVGSNIFNVFFILGLTATILTLPFNPFTNIDVLVSIGATFALFISMFVGRRHTLERWQGILFMLLYAIYIAYLIRRG